MVRMILHGCNGRMGRMIAGIVKDDPDIEIVAGVDINTMQQDDFPVTDSIDKVDSAADAVVDFGNAAAVDGVIDWCVANSVPLVECTTGLTEETLGKLKDASQKVAMLKSANMSVGINLIQKILRENSAVLAEAGFDIEIVEKHHRTKLDSPSGTALALADSVNDGLAVRKDYVFDRSARRMVRPDTEIGISAVRGGTIVGDHDVIFAGTDEVITFSHRAYSRAVFAKGAVSAAKFIKGKGAGMYDMSDVVG
ncbi:MAG: 4-hydroxy-tetrahydrodipicolinate reductase [Lachnospiraceae bacterium]|nr:4-hydroxy-tetrahydrodipicolinate reductase [Lachnospiraceae bacterium]